FILCVDRDGIGGRRAVLDNLENEAAGLLNESQLFLSENAWQEIEVWVLAGLELPPKWSWKRVREEANPKEIYYLPFAKVRKVIDHPWEGRKVLAREAATHYRRIRN